LFGQDGRAGSDGSRGDHLFEGLGGEDALCGRRLFGH
jgi:hypothetical protein